MKITTLFCVLSLIAAACIAQSHGPVRADSLALAAESARKPAAKARALCALCVARLKAGQLAAAVEAGRDGAALARKARAARQIRQCLLQYGNALHQSGSLDDAIPVYREAAELAENAGDLELLGAARLQLGSVYYRKGDFAGSLDQYHKSLSVARRRNDSLLILRTLNNIGVAYEFRSEIEKARDYYGQCLSFAKGNPKLTRNLGRTYHNIGNTFIRQGKVDSALHYYNKRLAHSEATGNRKGIENTLSQIGAALRDKGKHAESIQYFQKVLTLHRAQGNQYGEASSLDEISKTKYATGDYAESAAVGRKALAIARSIGADVVGRSITKTLYRADSVLGDMTSALAHYKLHKQFNDLIKNETQARAIGRVEAEYAYKQDLAKRARAEAEAAARREKLFWIAGGVFAALLLAAGLLSWGYRAKRNANRLLALQNAEIRQQSEEIRAQNEVIKDKNADLDAALAELRKLSAFKEHLTGMVVHDLKNPLSAILGLADQPNLEDRREALRAAALQMQGLTLNMLDVQKFETAGVKLDLKPVSASSIARSACAQVAFLAAAKRIELNADLPADLFMLADAAYLLRVLVNLLNNAVKFTPKGGNLSVAAAPAAGFVELSVKDSGPGIPEDKLETVFEKYAQLKNAQGANNHGVGLGLAFCKLAVEAHGGVIRAENATGGGAIFKLTIRRTEPAAETPLDVQEPLAKAAVPEASPLTPAEQTLVASVAAEMRRFDVHEISELIAALEPLAGTTSSGAEAWRRRAENAVYELDAAGLAAVLDEAEG